MEPSLLIEQRHYSAQHLTHSHDYPQLILPQQGSLKLEITGTLHQLTPEKGGVITPQTTHSFSALADNTFIVIDLYQYEAWHVLLEQAIKSPVFSITADFYPCLQLLAQYSSSGNASLHYHLSMVLLELLKNTNTPQYPQRLQAALSYIHSHYHCQMSIQKLAQLCCMSSSHFRAVFKQFMQCTPWQYLTKIRMERALFLLKNTQKPITHIAEQVGYQSPTAFSQCFSRYYQSPPSYYRSAD